MQKLMSNYVELRVACKRKKIYKNMGIECYVLKRHKILQVKHDCKGHTLIT